MKIPKPAFTPEFKGLAVKRVKASTGAVAKELGIVEQTLRNWVKAAAKGKLNGAGSRTVMPEEMESSRLWVDNARLKRELEIEKIRQPGLPPPFCTETVFACNLFLTRQ